MIPYQQAVNISDVAPTFIKYEKSQLGHSHKAVAHSIGKDRVSRDHHLHVLEDRIPDGLLGPELDFVLSREGSRFDRWEILGDHVMLLEA